MRTRSHDVGINGDSKVAQYHRDRLAFVYVRQSSLYQVEHHRESQRRQYDFHKMALDLGWTRDKVVVVDEDQGQSGSCPGAREGFGRIITAVGRGEAGVVMSLEASRLARNSPDWYTLIYMSRHSDTLIADEHGIYDPKDSTDRMVLGIRGQMSEMELDQSIHRMVQGRWNKARRGEYLVYPPVGYELDELNQVVMTSDEAVHSAIRTVFAKFDELQSAKRVFSWWRDEGLEFPVRRMELRGYPVVWLTPVYRMFLSVLHHPFYAGAYVFGRQKTVRELDPEDPRKVRVGRVLVPREQWPVLLKDHHPGYISFETYERNQKVIRNNQQMRRHDDEGQMGPTREGWALLQGLARCGHCGRQMYVSYGGSRPSAKSTRTLQYRCCAAKKIHGGKECQLVGGKQINDVVVEVFLEATCHAGLEAAELAVEQIARDNEEAEQAWQLQIEKAEYEARRAERQYNAVEPENRVVARTLEARWEACLRRVEELRTKAATSRQERRPLSKKEQERARRLGADLEAVWHAETTTNQDRKQLLRAAIEEVQLRSEEDHYAVKIVWKGGAVTDRQVPRRRRSDAAHATPQDTVQMVRLLATEFDDAQIARVLCKQGRLTGKGNPFTAHKVAQLRNRNGIALYPRHRARDPRQGPFTADQAAAELGVSTSTIQRWLDEGLLPGRQLAKGAPWQIVLSEELRRKLTAGEAPAGWVGLTEAAERLSLSKQQVAYLVKCGKLDAVRVRAGRRHCWKIDVDSASCGRQEKLF
jgi:DNA invertase Pin-like site-specific DNA recombinase